MAVADGEQTSTISAKGSLKPAAQKSWTLKGTDGDFTVKIDKLNMESLTPVFALMGKDIHAGGRLSADVEAMIDDGDFEKLDAQVELQGFKQKIAKET